MAIVDEFHHMSDLMKYDADIREQFDLVLREGRALGMHVIVADQTVGGLAGLSETAFSLMGGRVLLKWKDRREVPDMLGLPADELEHLRKGEGYLQADSGVNPIRFRGRFIAFGDIPNHEAQVRSRLDSPQRPLMSYDSTKRPIFGRRALRTGLCRPRETMNKSPERPRRGRSGRAGYGHLACRWLGK